MNTVNLCGETALMITAREGCNSCQQKLIECGATVNLIDSEGNTGLVNSTMAGNYHCDSDLVETGADVNRSNKRKDMVLTQVASCDSESFIKCFEVLIVAGANVNPTNKYGSSPRLSYQSRSRCELAWIRAEDILRCGS